MKFWKYLSSIVQHAAINLVWLFGLVILPGSVMAVDIPSHPLAKVTNLIDIYHMAYLNDPTFQQAQHDYLSAKEVWPQARAALLPNLTGTLGRNWEEYEDPTKVKFMADSWNLTLKQPLFDFGLWQTASQAKAEVRAAVATFYDQKQSLIYRTADAYISVLKAEDQAMYSAAQQEADLEQLHQTKQQYEVGSAPLTDLQSAQAAYDLIKANVIGDQAAVTNAKLQLAVIVGHMPDDLAKLNDHFNLVLPIPDQLDIWQRHAAEDNPSLLAAMANLDAKQLGIGMQKSDYIPSVVASGTYEAASNANAFSQDPTTQPGSWTHNWQVGVSLNWNLYQGGGTNSKIRQAEQNYQSAIAQASMARQTANTNTALHFLGIHTAVAQIEAGLQAVKSGELALKAEKTAYRAGTATILDVLNKISDLYNAKKSLSAARYQGISASLQLKQDTGMLSEQDLIELNHWLR